MKLSAFGEQLTQESGIVSLMEDLGNALNVNPDMLFLGGGNPAAVPRFERRIRRHLQALVSDPEKQHKLLGVYQSPQGNEDFIAALANYLSNKHGWPITARNIALTNGSQSAFFLLFNMLCGRMPNGDTGRICLPMMPEYLGYRDQPLASDIYTSYRPHIELLDEHRFKYYVDFDALSITPDIKALCVSRPTNPTGNVLTDHEMDRLNQLSMAHDIPLFVDCAYGYPFPGIFYNTASLTWQENQIFVLSLSKLGLPGVRTGIVIANEETIAQVVRANTITCLANGNLGPALGASLLNGDDMDTVCQTELLPYYREKRSQMLQLMDKHLAGIHYRIHQSEGAFFVWLWLPDLPVSSEVLYQRLKQKNVLVMAGEHFFFGLSEDWTHAQQCLRLNFCQSTSTMDRALELLATELRELLAA